VVGLSGSVVLEHVIRMPSVPLHGFQFGLKETPVIACWYLWWLRPKRTHNETIPPMVQYKIFVLAIASNSSKGANSRRQDETKWCKPDLRQVKVNVDGSFSADSLLGSVGAVLRDSNGKFIAGVAIYFPHMASAKLAKARAMKEGLILANQMVCSDKILRNRTQLILWRHALEI
jgi:hypothetical protein